MKKAIILNLNHVSINLINLSRRIDPGSADGRAFLLDLAAIRDQVRDAADNVKAIKEAA
jgi:hypothetical protein